MPGGALGKGDGHVHAWTKVELGMDGSQTRRRHHRESRRQYGDHWKRQALLPHLGALGCPGEDQPNAPGACVSWGLRLFGLDTAGRGVPGLEDCREGVQLKVGRVATVVTTLKPMAVEEQENLVS